MLPIKNNNNEQDAWQHLKAFTAARIALGRAGTSIPLQETLNTKMAHAHARDAVYATLHEDELTQALQSFQLPIYYLQSKVADRTTYLQRPDLGRRLNDESVEQLTAIQHQYDIAFVIADGLSATAVNKHAANVLQLIVPAYQKEKLNIAPFIIVQQARVAIGDEIASLLNAKMVVVLIGERPGLSSPDSMGAYITYNPAIGLTDERRNCISNIRNEGLVYESAAQKIMYLIKQSFQLKLSGVQLKEETGLFE
jgi:ethanolamine ammonia-lyase small subunit